VGVVKQVARPGHGDMGELAQAVAEGGHKLAFRVGEEGAGKVDVVLHADWIADGSGKEKPRVGGAS